MTFDLSVLSSSDSLDDKDYLTYMQIRSQLANYFGEVVKIPTATEVEILFESMVKQKHKIVSKLYKMLNGPTRKNWSAAQINWETDLG